MRLPCATPSVGFTGPVPDQQAENAAPGSNMAWMLSNAKMPRDLAVRDALIFFLAKLFRGRLRLRRC
jgi:hypothetical protein